MSVCGAVDYTNGVDTCARIFYQKLLPETCLHTFLEHVSYSRFFWYKFLALSRMQLCLSQETSVQVIKIVPFDWSFCLFGWHLCRNSRQSCCYWFYQRNPFLQLTVIYHPTFFVAFNSVYHTTVVLCTHLLIGKNHFTYLFLYLDKSYRSLIALILWPGHTGRTHDERTKKWVVRCCSSSFVIRSSSELDQWL